MRYKSTLRKVIIKAVEYGFEIKNLQGNNFYKGDLDGKTIWIDFNMSKKEMLFNTLHLLGHSLQWSINEELRALGDKLHKNPSDELLLQLQRYEWEANCYALDILHQIGTFDMDQWFEQLYLEDMYYLTNFYKTGEKSKKITEIAKQYAFLEPLKPLTIPEFTVHASEHTRDRTGIVIA